MTLYTPGMQRFEVSNLVLTATILPSTDTGYVNFLVPEYDGASQAVFYIEIGMSVNGGGPIVLFELTDYLLSNWASQNLSSSTATLLGIMSSHMYVGNVNNPASFGYRVQNNSTTQSVILNIYTAYYYR